MGPRSWLFVWAIACLSVQAGRVAACPCCSAGDGITVVEAIKKASMVIAGTIIRSSAVDSTTDLSVERVLKHHEFLDGPSTLAGKASITIPTHLGATKHKYVIFLGVHKGTLETQAILDIHKRGHLLSYMDEAIRRKNAGRVERLRFYFDHLQDPDSDIAFDAHLEFSRATYEQTRRAAKQLPADTIVGWLQHPKTPLSRFGLYSTLLAECGNDRHAIALRQIIDDPKHAESRLDSVMSAHAILRPQEGIERLQAIMRNPQNDLVLRYSALKAIRFLDENRPDVISKNETHSTIALLLDHPDAADFAIEEFRTRRCWDYSDAIFDLFCTESHSRDVVKRAILRYALRCPRSRARKFIAEHRQRDPVWVLETEELLRLEYPNETKK